MTGNQFFSYPSPPTPSHRRLLSFMLYLINFQKQLFVVVLNEKFLLPFFCVAIVFCLVEWTSYNGEMSDKSIKRQHNPISLSEHFDEYEIFVRAAVPLLRSKLHRHWLCVVFFSPSSSVRVLKGGRRKNATIISLTQMSFSLLCLFYRLCVGGEKAPHSNATKYQINFHRRHEVV